MFFRNLWYTIKVTAKKAAGWVSIASIITTAGVHAIFSDFLKNAAMLEAVKDYIPLLTLLGCFIVLFTFAVILQLWESRGDGTPQVPADHRPIVTYRVFPYRPGEDLERLSEFAHKVFEGDTMKAEIVQHAVRMKAAVGLRLTNPQGENVGFLDAFHFTEDIMQQWMNGDIAEDALRKEDFRKIPARGEELDLAVGAIYVARRSAANHTVHPGVAHHFANIGELFLRKSFPKFHRINLYATIFPSGKRIANDYKFAVKTAAAKRTGRYANGHDLRLKMIDLDSMPHLIGGIGGGERIIVELMS